MPSRREVAMLLNRNEVRDSGILQHFSAARWRSVGYDLSVGKMYIPRDDESNAGNCYVDEMSYEIPPQGIVLIFSGEKVTIPNDVCGYAMPKTQLCEEGLLVLNTGILDPGYRGRISGTTINFGKKPYKITRGDAFLRLTFHRLNAVDPPTTGVPDEKMNDELYYAKRIVAANDYPATFLNIPDTVKTITEKVTKDLLDKERSFFLRTLTVIGLILGVLTAFGRWGVPAIDTAIEELGSTNERLLLLENAFREGQP